MEKDTIYAYKLQHIENPTFDNVQRLARTFINDLPQPMVDEIYVELNRGVDQLTTEPQMLVYLHAFGNMHQSKLRHAFEQLPDYFRQQPRINIIDYGCGQAIGTICYADFLHENGLNQSIGTITLIEPSEFCLRRAALHAKAFFPDAEIRTIHKGFDDLDAEDIQCDESIPTLHILSNVLDILDFDLGRFAKLIDGQLCGYNQFVCVGPYFNYSNKDNRMELFAELLDGNISFSKSLEKGELNANKTWTAQIVCFSVGELEEKLSTEVTQEDIENGVEEVDYCIYSPDGKRMISYGNTYGENYRIKNGTIVICNECFFDVYSEIDLNYISQLYIPKSIKYIGKNPFCRSIENIICESPYFFVKKGFLLTKDGKKVVFYFGKEKNISIPDGVVCIGSGSFCSLNFSSITIPSSVNEIEDNPFVDARRDNNLPFDIIIESSRYSFSNNLLFDNIEKRVISYCGKETEFEIPDGTKVIGKNAFFGTEFKKVILPNSIEYIDETAFYWCFNLKTIIIPIGCKEKFKEILPKNLWNKLALPTKSSYKEIESGFKDEFGVVYSRDGKRLLKIQNEHLEKYKIKEGTNVICNESFGSRAAFFHSSLSLQNITIPNTVTCIGDYAFSSCKQLKQIFIPNSVISIGDCAFNFCESLLEVQISYSVTSIGEYAFSNCESLLQINIPDSITKLYARTFSSCKHLQHIIIPNSVTHIDNFVFEQCHSLHQIIIPNSVKTIGKGAFAYCYALQQIYISNSDTNIARDAFIDCGSLQQIIIPEGSTEKFKEMLPEQLWDKLYCLKKAE